MDSINYDRDPCTDTKWCVLLRRSFPFKSARRKVPWRAGMREIVASNATMLNPRDEARNGSVEAGYTNGTAIKPNATGVRE